MVESNSRGVLANVFHREPVSGYTDASTWTPMNEGMMLPNARQLKEKELVINWENA